MSSSLPTENLTPAQMKRLSSGPLAVAKFLIETFSTVRQREPPIPSKTSHIRFITIGVSHYCEKARFVLDHVEANPDSPYYYTEDAHPPAFHAYETLKVTENTISATPMIVFEEDGQQQIIYDSSHILQKFLPELYPTEIQSQVEDVEADLGKRLGATVRCFSYYHLLANVKDNHDLLVQICADPNKVAKIESVVFDKFLEKGLADGMMKSMGIDKESSDASEASIRQVFAEWSNQLENNGGKYLLDTKDEKSYGFTAADLTFAALAYPLLQPPEMKEWLVSNEKLPLVLQNMTKELQATKAGQHALKIYRENRLPDGSKFVTMKYADRSKSVLRFLKRAGVACVAVISVGFGIVLSRRYQKTTKN